MINKMIKILFGMLLVGFMILIIWISVLHSRQNRMRLEMLDNKSKIEKFDKSLNLEYSSFDELKK